jgi:hypothetical protein
MKRLIPFSKFTPINELWKTEKTKAKRAEKILYEYVDSGPDKKMEMIVFKNIETGDYYSFYAGNIDKKDLYEYGEIDMEYDGKDEDGNPQFDYDYENFEITPDIIENYVNDNLDKIKTGGGINDYESGDDLLVKVDGEIFSDLIRTFKISGERMGIPPQEGWLEVK